MMSIKKILLLVIIAGLVSCAKVEHKDPLNQYNQVWDSPCEYSSGSMPLGNGDIGVNAWVEKSGDLLFYIGKTDTWSENGRLIKLGKVRVSFSPVISSFFISDLRTSALLITYLISASKVLGTICW